MCGGVVDPEALVVVVELVGAAPPLVADRDGATGNVLSNGGDGSDSPPAPCQEEGGFSLLRCVSLGQTDNPESTRCRR